MSCDASRSLAILLTSLHIIFSLPARADEPGASALRRVPPPPVKILPMSVIEPPRNVLAAQWKSPYCTQWADGVTMCERRNARSRITCKPIAPSQNYPKPERHPVACFSADFDALIRVCQEFSGGRPERYFPYVLKYFHGTPGDRLDYYSTDISWEWNNQSRKWSMRSQVNLGVATVQNEPQPLAQALERRPSLGNWFCSGPYTENTKSNFNNLESRK